MKHLFAMTLFFGFCTFSSGAFAYPGQACAIDSECTGFGGFTETCQTGACHGQAGFQEAGKSVSLASSEVRAAPVPAVGSVANASTWAKWSVLLGLNQAHAQSCQNADESCRTSNDCCGSLMCHNMGRGFVCW